MTPDEREQMFILCQRLAEEQDIQKFAVHVQTLNSLLQNKAKRLRVAEPSVLKT